MNETWTTAHIYHMLRSLALVESILISDLLEMFHFFACLRVRVTSEVFTTKFVPIATLSVAIFLVIAIIACTAAKAFEEQTWTAFAILLVVSVQVPGYILCKCIFLESRYAVEIDK